MAGRIRAEHLDQVVHVDDLDRAEAFYGDLLGVSLPLVVPEGIDEVAYRDEQSAQGFPSVHLATDDVYAEHARLAAAGVRVVEGPRSLDGMDYVYLDDGCGNVVQLTSVEVVEPVDPQRARTMDDAIRYYDATPADDVPADDVARAVWHLGAVAVLAGLVDNGGLVGTIENCAETEGTFVEDGARGLRSLGLDSAADHVERAAHEYRRMRPNGSFDDLGSADERLWDELDEAWWVLVDEVWRVLRGRLVTGD